MLCIDEVKELVLFCEYSYTIVIDVNTSWVRAPSDLVEVNHPPRNYALVKSHGKCTATLYFTFVCMKFYGSGRWPSN